MNSDKVTPDVAKMLADYGMPVNGDVSIYDAQQWLLSRKIFIHPHLWFNGKDKENFVNWGCEAFDFSIDGICKEIYLGQEKYNSYQDAINTGIKSYLTRKNNSK